MTEQTYNTRTWLNRINSPSSGSVVCFSGDVIYKDESYKTVYVEISDCHCKIRLHKTENDTIEDFIEKLELLEKEISFFITHLKETSNEKE